MFKIAKIVESVVSKNALSSVAKGLGKTAIVKLPLTLAKLTTGMIPMLISGVLGGVFLLIKFMK
jgi:hypothetical protein